VCCCEALARQRYNCRTKRHKHSLSKGPLPLHTRHRVIEAVLNQILGLHNKPKTAVHSVHKLTGPKKKKKAYVGVKVQLYIFLTLPLALTASPLTKSCWGPLNRMVSEPQSQSGHCGRHDGSLVVQRVV